MLASADISATQSTDVLMSTLLFLHIPVIMAVHFLSVLNSVMFQILCHFFQVTHIHHYSFMLTRCRLPVPALCTRPAMAAWTGSPAAPAGSAPWHESPASSPPPWHQSSALSKTLSCFYELWKEIQNLHLCTSRNTLVLTHWITSKNPAFKVILQKYRQKIYIYIETYKNSI